MKTSKRYKVKASNVRSMKDIELEKQRLRLEIMKTEATIHADYKNILQALTFKNIAKNIVNDIPTASTIMSKAFSYGKLLLEKRKKKKHDKSREVHPESES